MADDVKKVNYLIRGSVELADGVALDQAMASIRELAEKAREYGTATVDVSVPRLTRVKL